MRRCPEILLVGAFLFCLSGAMRAQKASEEQPSHVLTDGDTVTIPFELGPSDIFLKARVNGVELRLVLDNGVLWDSLLLYGRPKLDGLELEMDGATQIGQAGDANATEANTASGITVELPGVELRNQSAVVTPPDSRFSQLFVGHDGIISGSLFSHYIVAIDFDERKIRLTAPEAFDREEAGEALTMSPSGRGSMGVPCTLLLPGGKHVTLHPALDLGGVQPLLLYLENRPDIPVPDSARAGDVAIGERGFLGPIPELRIGSHTLKNVTTGFTKHPALMGPTCDGLLGLPLLARFNLTFDYGSKQVYLKPNRRFHDAFEPPRRR